MKKSFLINYYTEKLKFKRKTKIVFKDEFLLKCYSKDKLKNYQISFLDSIEKVYNKNKNVPFLTKKLKKYRKSLSKKLNLIHQVNFSEKEWGLLLDYYILISIIFLKRKIDNFKKIKNKKIVAEVSDNKMYFFNTESVREEFLHGKKLNHFADYIILNQLGFVNFKKIKYSSDTAKIKNKKNSIIKNYILNFFFKVLKPTIIFNGYFGLKNSLKIMILSKFKVLVLDAKLLNELNYSNKKDHILRKKILIDETDEFDKIFNRFNNNIMPSSFLENFNLFYKINFDFSKNIKNIGSAILLPISDYYKFLSLLIKRNNGKIISFQHGGLFGMRKFSPDDLINNYYSDVNLLWHDKNGIGPAYFDKNQSTKNTNKRTGILLFPTINLFQEMTENLKKCNHIYLNPYWNFYSLISPKLKKITKIKLFNHPNSKKLRKIWVDRYSEDLLLDIKSYKGNLYKNFKITIIDNFSTPLFELLYQHEPFIIINNSKLLEFTHEFKLIIRELKKLNLLFSSEKKASQFINKNYSNLDVWWDDIKNNVNYKKLRNKLFPVNNFNKRKLINKINR